MDSALILVEEGQEHQGDSRTMMEFACRTKSINGLPDKTPIKDFHFMSREASWYLTTCCWKLGNPGRIFLKRKKNKTVVPVLPRQRGLEGPISPSKGKYEEIKLKFIIIFSLESSALGLPGGQEAEKLSRIQQSSMTSVDEENKKLKRRAHHGEEPSKHF